MLVNYALSALESVVAAASLHTKKSRQRQGMASPTAVEFAEWTNHKRALHRTRSCDSPEDIIFWPSLCPGGGHQASAGSPFLLQIRIRHPLQDTDDNLRLNPCSFKKIALLGFFVKKKEVFRVALGNV